MKVQSYIKGKWIGKGEEKDLISAVTNEPVAQIMDADTDYKGVCKYARSKNQAQTVGMQSGKI